LPKQSKRNHEQREGLALLPASAKPTPHPHSQPRPTAQKNTQELYRAAGEASRQGTAEAARRQLASFRAALEAFARDHRADIRADPSFRAQFHAMCANVGVDPLASNKGAWAQLLGLGDFYYELGVAALEAAWASRPADGGLVPLSALTRAVARRRGSAADPVSEDDVARALKKLRALGPGVDVVELGGVAYVRSVPGDLDPDRGAALGAASAPGRARRPCGNGTAGGGLTVSDLVRATGWARPRAEAALDGLLREGLAMADDQGEEAEEGEEGQGDDGGWAKAAAAAAATTATRRGGGGKGDGGGGGPARSARIYWVPCLWDGAAGGASGSATSTVQPLPAGTSAAAGD